MISTRDRVAGLLVPLFSTPSTDSWGIGEFCDIPLLAGWLRRAGVGILQLLPLNETSRDECSPYSPLTAMALDPQYIALRSLEDFQAIGGEAALDEDVRSDLAHARRGKRVDYRRVRAAKHQALKRAFDRFAEEEWTPQSSRAEALQRYVEEQSWWLDAYALFRVLRAAGQEQSWSSWPEPLQRGDPAALEATRADHERDMLFYQYVQWIAEEQWQAVRRAARPVAIFGDFPFLVTIDSADVWARQSEFLLDATVGAPPDAFSQSGQDWGLPPCNWEVMAARGDEWIRHRARRMAALFDGYRVDHLVGFYRTYVRPHDGPAYFAPASVDDQLAQGERLMRIFLESGARVTVEDLGAVPLFVRASLARLGVAGYRVMRWERKWDQPGHPFLDPAAYPAVSVATTGTHDTETLAGWWESLSLDDRASITALPTVTRIAGDAQALTRPTFDERTRDILVETLYASGSDLLILPVQDVFGWRDRINEPGNVSDGNWTFKLPWPVDRLESQPQVLACAERLRIWAERHGRI
jgi:4-alpha-glucanotransferase